MRLARGPEWSVPRDVCLKLSKYRIQAGLGEGPAH